MKRCSSAAWSCETQQLTSRGSDRQDVCDEVRDELHYKEALLLLPAEVTWQHEELAAGTNDQRHVSSAVDVWQISVTAFK